MSIITRLIRTFVESRAGRTSIDEIRAELETTAGEVSGRIAGAKDTPANRLRAGHIIGIERWGINRLRGIIDPGSAPVPGETPLDEYDNYRPAAELDMPALAETFRSARAETLALIDPLRALQDCTAPHNDLGMITARGWLIYLISHATMESKRLR